MSIGTPDLSAQALGAISTNAFPLRVGGYRCAVMGDSTAARAASYDATETSGYYSWFDHMVALSQGRLLRTRNAGSPGDTSGDMIARWSTDIAPFLPDIVFIQAGTNDCATSHNVALSTTIANIFSMCALAEGSGAVPIVVSIFPNANVTGTRGIDGLYQAQAATLLNSLVAEECLRRGVLFIDPCRGVIDPTTINGYVAADTTDNIHPSHAGCEIVGLAAWNVLKSWLPSFTPTLFPKYKLTSAANTIDPFYLHTGGCVNSGSTSTDGGSFVVPYTWNGGSGSTSGSASFVTDALIVPGGQWWEWAASSETAVRTCLAKNVATGITPGDRVAAFCRVQTDAPLRTIDGQFSVEGIWKTGGGTTISTFFMAQSWDLDCSQAGGCVFYTEQIAPATAAQLTLQMTVNKTTTSFTGHVRFADFGTVNLTAKGVTVPGSIKKGF